MTYPTKPTTPAMTAHRVVRFMEVLRRLGKGRARAVAAAGLLLAAVACQPRAPGGTAGGSRGLARHRARTLEDIRYDLRLGVPAGRGAPIRGVVSVRVAVGDASFPLVLDFAAPPSSLLALRVGGREVRPDLRAGHVVVPAADAGSACTTARPTQPKWSATARPFWTCTSKRSSGWRRTPASRIPSGNSTSSWSRRSSTAGWNTRAPFSTGPTASCSTNPPPRTRSWAAPA